MWLGHHYELMLPREGFSAAEAQATRIASVLRDRDDDNAAVAFEERDAAAALEKVQQMIDLEKSMPRRPGRHVVLVHAAAGGLGGAPADRLADTALQWSTPAQYPLPASLWLASATPQTDSMDGTDHHHTLHTHKVTYCIPPASSFV